jgi:choline-sulfatase
MSTPVGLYDIFPTLCDLAGVEAPSDLNGRSLASSVREGKCAKIQPVVCDNFMPRWGEGSQFRSIRLGDYKYVRFKDAQPLFFNLRNDPEEQRNLLVHELSPEAQDVLDSLKESSELNIDFDDIEKTRLERDGSLREDFAIGFDRKGHVHLNQYHFPSGRIIAADDPVYSPTVISESAEALFGKDWNRQNSSDNT